MIVLRALVTLAAVIIVVARPNIIESPEEVKVIKFFELLKREAKFQCGPQERSFFTKDLLAQAGKTLDSNEHLRLNNIVLHRCDEYSGCCQNGQICTPLQSQKVILQIKVQKIRPENRSRVESRDIEIPAINHTACECMNKSSPKRDDTNADRVNALISSGNINNLNKYYKVLWVASVLYFIYYERKCTKL